MNNSVESSYESMINIVFKIRSKNNKSCIIFNSLQQVAYFLIGILIVSAGNGTTFSKESVGLVEEENPVFILCLRKNFFHILLCFTNIFANYLSQVNAIYIFIELSAQ